jgi:hypothetical protein
MLNSPFELREFFHLVFLQHLAGRLSNYPWAVNGGICLRFFHRSQRLSQDMDLDVAPQMQGHLLQTSVDKILTGNALQSALASQGIVRLQPTKPKQTETVQRWKVALLLADGSTLPTKIEFSRRQEEITWTSGIPDRALLAHYALAPFAARFYGAAAMASQKIRALASSSRFATRDLFDLHHLVLAVAVKPEEVAGQTATADVAAALAKIDRFTHRDFQEQVLPYLSGTLIDALGSAEAFARIKSEVALALSEMI